MAWPVYSYRLAAGKSLSSSTSFGGPAPGTVWIVRWLSVTWGINIAQVPGLGISIGPNGPWSWFTPSPIGNYGLFNAGSMSTFLHYVVQAGQELWCQGFSPSTVDFDIHGYILTAQP